MQNGRLIRASGSSASTVAARVDVSASVFPGGGAFGMLGLLLRYVDTSNFLAAYILGYGSGTTTQLGLTARVAGTDSLFAFSETLPVGMGGTILASVTAQGAATLSYVSSGGSTLLSTNGSHSSLATGGALASGTVGLIDYWPSATASTRTYDNFLAWVPASSAVPAVMYASRNALVTGSRAERQDSAGSYYGKIPAYAGPYFTLPAANAGSTCRLIVKASRADPYNNADPAIDDIGVKIAHTPQYLQVPA
jgi:hypothetical protein